MRRTRPTPMVLLIWQEVNAGDPGGPGKGCCCRRRTQGGGRLQDPPPSDFSFIYRKRLACPAAQKAATNITRRLKSPPLQRQPQ